MDALLGGWEDSLRGVAESTISNQSSHMQKWRAFLDYVGINDEWLDRFRPEQRQRIVGAFAKKIRNNKFGKTKKKTLKCCTIRATISNVSTTFRLNGKKDPRLDDHNQKCIALQRQLNGYEDADPNVKNQLPIPIHVLKNMLSSATGELETATAELLSGATFFGMRSCEYLNVGNDSNKLVDPDEPSNERRTIPLRLSDLRFFHNNMEITNRRLLSQADFVQITFRFQKNKNKFESINQFRANDPSFCPVLIWARIKQRILSYRNTSDESFVYVFEVSGRLYDVTSAHARSLLRHYVKLDDPLGLQYDLSRIGTHSIRVTLVMVLHTAGAGNRYIMGIGRWKSKAFQKYLRQDMPDFNKGISTLIASSKATFLCAPSKTPVLPHLHSFLCPDNGLHTDSFQSAPQTIYQWI